MTDKELFPCSFCIKRQTEKAIGVYVPGDDEQGLIWLPKSQIEVDGIQDEDDWESLPWNEPVDMYLPRWLIEAKDLTGE